MSSASIASEGSQERVTYRVEAEALNDNPCSKMLSFRQARLALTNTYTARRKATLTNSKRKHMR